MTVSLTEARVGGGALALGAGSAWSVDPLAQIIPPWSIVTGIVPGHPVRSLRADVTDHPAPNPAGLAPDHLHKVASALHEPGD